MDLFAKDHPLEAAALRMQIAGSKIRSFEFEKLPPTVRRRIYRGLLLKPIAFDDMLAESYDSEPDALSNSGLAIFIGEGDNQMHPEIMRTNKKIHKEAAAVLYGENTFEWSLYGHEYLSLWHFMQGASTSCPRHYSRLITKLHLDVSTRGYDYAIKNIQHACKVLALNDFKTLKVDFYHPGSRGKVWYGERYLEPLKKCRAEEFLINTYVSRHYAAELKSVIEGPKDAGFLAYRQATEDEPESDYDEPRNSLDKAAETEEIDYQHVGWLSEDEDEGPFGLEGLQDITSGRG